MSDEPLATSFARLMIQICAAMKLRSHEPPGNSPLTLLQVRTLSILSVDPRTVGELAQYLGSTVGSASSLAGTSRQAGSA